MDKRVCVILDDDVNKKLRVHQSKLILKNKTSVSFSGTINQVVQDYFSKK